MCIRKSVMEEKNLILKKIQKALEKELTLSSYIYGENDVSVFWIISLIINAIRQEDTGEKVTELARSKSLIDFQMMNNILV